MEKKFDKYRAQKKEQYQDKLEELNLIINSSCDYKIYLERANILKQMYEYDKALLDFDQAFLKAEKETFIDKDHYKILNSILKLKIQTSKDAITFLTRETGKVPDVLYTNVILDINHSIDFIRTHNIHQEVFRNNRLASLYFMIGNYSFKLKNYQAAIVSMNNSIKLNDSISMHTERFKLLVRAHLIIGDKDSAYESCQYFLNTNKWEYYEFIGSITNRIGRFSEAIEHYSSAIAIKDRIDIIAGSEIETVHKKNTRIGEQYLSRGLIHYKMNNKELAFKDFIYAYENDESLRDELDEFINNEEFRAYVKKNQHN